MMQEQRLKCSSLFLPEELGVQCSLLIEGEHMEADNGNERERSEERNLEVVAIWTHPPKFLLPCNSRWGMVWGMCHMETCAGNAGW
jgi:hypothetical protein